jgi:hypothetical protein
MMFTRNIIPAYKYLTSFAPAECKTWIYADVHAVVVKIARSNVKLHGWKFSVLNSIKEFAAFLRTKTDGAESNTLSKKSEHEKKKNFTF